MSQDDAFKRTKKGPEGWRVDRTGWRPGPWDDEPGDHAEFMASGFPCLLRRHSLGHWCGYVGVPKTHICYGLKDTWEGPLGALEVHGGVSYAKVGDEFLNFEALLVPKDLWLIGFDMNHAWDIAPGFPIGDMPDSVYRTQDDARAAVRHLAEQLAALSPTMPDDELPPP